MSKEIKAKEIEIAQEGISIGFSRKLLSRIDRLEMRIEALENNLSIQKEPIEKAYDKGYQEGKESLKNNLEFKDLIIDFYQKSFKEIKALVKEQKALFNVRHGKYGDLIMDISDGVGEQLDKLHALIEKHFGE